MYMSIVQCVYVSGITTTATKSMRFTQNLQHIAMLLPLLLSCNMLLSFTTATAAQPQIPETEITQHVRRCCNAGLQYALHEHHCLNAEYEVATIPPLWRGLCLSTFNVCCTRSIDDASCVAGRKAALIGASCNELPTQLQQHNISSTVPTTSAAYGSCCRACQVGLAVKASAIDCNDVQFAYFKQIQSYRICCGNELETTATDDRLQNSSHTHSVELYSAGAGGVDTGTGGFAVANVSSVAVPVNRSQDRSNAVVDGNANSDDDDGTIVLNEDDDDICGKVANLCEQICENTNEAYRCKCRPDYKLDDNNVTCTYVGNNISASTIPPKPHTNKVNVTNRLSDDEDEDDVDDIGGDLGVNGGVGADTDDVISDDDDLDDVDDEAVTANIDDTDVNIGDDIDGDGDIDDTDDLLPHTASVGVNGGGGGVDGVGARRCLKGYAYDAARRKCIDIDECQLSASNCGHNEYCHNIVGSYRCLSVRGKKHCDPGYRYDVLNGGNCVDINECIEQQMPCDTIKQKCHNYPGGYECEPLKLPTLTASGPSLIGSSSSGGGSSGGSGRVGGAGTSTLLRGYNIALGTHTSNTQCGDGFQSKHGRCMDIDECNDDQHACDSTQICTNDIGGYHCDCKIGYNLDATTNACIDINECSINNHNCVATQRCDNTVGSYICTRLQSCGTGYTLNAETGNCDDDDECTLNTHNCPKEYECYNTKGSFRCYRRISTTTTTTTTTTSTTSKPLTATTSAASKQNFGQSFYDAIYSAQQTHSGIDVNHNMHPVYYNNNNNKYLQQNKPANNVLPPCAMGFQRNHMQACIDINECTVGKPCGTHQQCINTNGSYRCQNLLQCMAGYKSTPDGSRCIDIDECETGEHKCVENQLCRNRNGGYVCTCPPGHQLQRIGSSGYNRCMDINECEQPGQSVCPSNAQCFNTIGSFYCECVAGYQKSAENERFCLDVDECQQLPGRLCQQKCNNYWGGYRCTCNQGYELNADNRTCNDVDECEVHKAYRPCMGFCINVPGSYECSCPRGYMLGMDQNTCRDIDECAAGEVCTGRTDICTNTRGGYKCTPINCPYGYANDPDQKNRCLQKNNLCDGDDCYTKPSAYTYNFITLTSKLLIPPDGRIIFTLRGPAWYDYIDFHLKIIQIQAAANIEKASDNHFEAIKHQHEVNVSLKRMLEGPQDIELELSMTVFTNNVPRGKSVAKIIIFVSQYGF